MSKPTRIAAALAAVILSGLGPAFGQQIEWTQTINLPKGLNLPQGLKADILGIELGETYETAKPKLEALFKAATNTPDQNKKFTNLMQRFRLSTPSGPLEISYPGGIRVEIRRYQPAVPPKEHDWIQVNFSAPSSGQQVIGIKRTISYQKQEDQIRVSELLASLKAKYGSEPQLVGDYGRSRNYLFRYADGKLFRGASACKPLFLEGTNPAGLKNINTDGTCDVALLVEVNVGISKDHAEVVRFVLADNERTKQNLLADFAYFDSYVEKRRQQSGTAPKL